MTRIQDSTIFNLYIFQVPGLAEFGKHLSDHDEYKNKVFIITFRILPVNHKQNLPGIAVLLLI